MFACFLCGCRLSTSTVLYFKALRVGLRVRLPSHVPSIPTHSSFSSLFEKSHDEENRIIVGIQRHHGTTPWNRKPRCSFVRVPIQMCG